MTKLTDTQLIILSAAALRESGTVRPLPKTLKADEAAIEKLLKALQKRGLIAAQVGPAKGRPRADGKIQFLITDAGRSAIAVDEGADAPGGGAAPAPARPASKAAGTAPAEVKPALRPTSKLGQVAALLRRQEGGSIEEIIAATGWQAHSVRGAISGALKKKHGLTVTSIRAEDGSRRYRIEAAA